MHAFVVTHLSVSLNAFAMVLISISNVRQINMKLQELSKQQFHVIICLEILVGHVGVEIRPVPWSWKVAS